LNFSKAFGIILEVQNFVHFVDTNRLLPGIFMRFTESTDLLHENKKAVRNARWIVFGGRRL